MTKAELLALAERCEAATGPDQELDAEIDLLALEMGWRAERRGGGLIPDQIPAYTASLDAALTLVPAHCSWARWHNGTIEVGTPENIICKVTKANSAALALCVAALRARAKEAADE